MCILRFGSSARSSSLSSSLLPQYVFLLLFLLNCEISERNNIFLSLDRIQGYKDKEGKALALIMEGRITQKKSSEFCVRAVTNQAGRKHRREEGRVLCQYREKGLHLSRIIASLKKKRSPLDFLQCLP